MLLHGATGTLEMPSAGWGGLAPALAERYRAIQVEHRGHGRTDNPAGSLTYPQIAQDIAAFVEALGLAPAHVAGVSDGGIIALALGMARPELVRSLVLVGANEENGARLEAAAEALPGEVVFRRGDVRVEEDVVGAIEACTAAWGGLDVIVNNAGILGPEGPLHETTTEGWDEVNDTNVRGVFFGTKHAILTMKDAGGGSIVQIGSILSSTGDPFLTAYTATKHGVLGLTRAVAVDYAAAGIRCNCVCPGDMLTPMIEAYFAASPDPAAAREEMEAAYPCKRIAHPREVAYACLYLASDESAFVSGTSLIVDGALTAKAY